MTPEDNLKKMLDRARGPDHVPDEEWNAFVTTARRSLRTQRLLSVAGVLVVVAFAALVTTSLDDAGPNDQNVQPVGSPDDTVPAPGKSPTAPPRTASEQEVWYVDPITEKLSWGTRIVPVEEGNTLRAVILEVLRPPIGPDQEAGVVTHIPKGTSLLGVTHQDGVAEIDLSAEFMNNDGDSATENVGESAEKETALPGTMRFREAQIVFTATQVPEVDEVMILVEGEPYMGAVNPSSRDEYEDVAPPIVVEQPKIGDSIELPLFVGGTANVFEGTVTIEIDKTEENEQPLQTFATATCGSGCWGDFTKKIEFNLDKPTRVRLNIYEESAEDGSRQNVISLPITLRPGD